ncbi:MAG TPA: metalloregulator ArsR/SmtB family transcription factor [Thermoleophilia bacterium]|nr:metalloregulator ArsR/SmtB family transcription factor [Thermoleophilia bacterium]
MGDETDIAATRPLPVPGVYYLEAGVCRALADVTRLRIVDELATSGPRSVGSLCTSLDAPQSTVSRHLKVLREQSLVTAKHEGATVTYDLADERIVDLLKLVRELLRSVLDERMRLVASLGPGGAATI